MCASMCDSDPAPQCLLEQLDGTPSANVENQLGPVTLGTWFACSSPQQLSHIEEGEWRLAIRATDAVGNQVRSVLNLSHIHLGD